MGRVRRGHALPGERRAGRSWAAGTGPPGCPGGLGAALPCPALPACTSLLSAAASRPSARLHRPRLPEQQVR